MGLEVANKPDSQDICFVPNGNYREVINSIKPNASKPGPIIDYNTGNILGEHTGSINYTIGQRKGIGISCDKPLYVVSINSQNNSVIVGEKGLLKRNILLLNEINIINKLNSTQQAIDENIKDLVRDSLDTICDLNKLWCKVSDISVRVRSTGDEIPATLLFEKNGFAIVFLKQSVYGIAPGQACVFIWRKWCCYWWWLDKKNDSIAWIKF